MGISIKKRGPVLAFVIASAILVAACNARQEEQKQKPNIVFIYIDDLGYGDVGCYGATDVRTPNVDALAANGIKFTDAHCGASTCTPSRFSLLTGIYAFRNKAAVLPGDAPLLIKPGSETLPALLQKAGYATAVVGKWHLGLGNGHISWNDSIYPGPNATGFNYSFIIPATTDRVPTVYVENGRVPNLNPNDTIAVSYAQTIGDEPTGLDHPELLKMGADTQHSNTIINGISRIGYMRGGKSARWVDEDIADVLTAKATQFIEENRSKPFFLYFAVPDIHVPRAPNNRFVGATKMGRRGDVIAEMDWMTGEIVKQLKKLGIDKNTLIVFSSDNGPVLDDGYKDEAEELVGNHKPAGLYRGGKYSAFEAGTRVPTITYLPGRIKPATSQALWSQVDLLASMATLAGIQATSTTRDSKNILPVILGDARQGSIEILEESYTLGLRLKQWKYIAPLSGSTPGWLKNKKIETGLMQVDQLYDLANDPRELHNIASEHPDIVARCKGELSKITGRQ